MKTKNIKEYTFRSLEERSKFFRLWEKRQKGQIKYGCAGEYIGKKEILAMGGKTISIHRG